MFRTALDVLQPSAGYGYGYPWGLAGYQPGYFPTAPLAPFLRIPASVSVAVSPVQTDLV